MPVNGSAQRTGLPAQFAQRPLRTVTVGDAAAFYRHPRQQLAKLVDRGLLHRVAHGYYVVVPQDRVGSLWLPELEAVTAGIAVAAFRPDDAVLMGVSAARVLGAIPRALATGVVAVPRQRRSLRLLDRDATVRFVARNTQHLDAELIRTELGETLATTPEQTVLDLTHRPTLGDAESDISAAVRTLFTRCDRQRLAHLANDQRLTAALRRATAIATEKP